VKKKDFYIDESPNGARYYIDGDLVSQIEFNERRHKECSHRYNGYQKECMDCALEDK
jgi:hypothetical protein